MNDQQHAGVKAACFVKFYYPLLVPLLYKRTAARFYD